ncbi:MAG: hypothetical protein WCS88_03220 [Patescibacteria group bacterium]|jgi:hypothetical protein
MVQDPKIEQINISPEQANSSEQSPEKILDSTKIEQSTEFLSKEKLDDDQIAAQVAIVNDKAQKVQPATSEIIHKKVENILSDGMDIVFLSLDAGTQRIFKLKGEEVSTKITILLLEAKIKVGEITKLILEWLRIIPKVNKYYLEQEAKIKTDKILKINQK